MLQQDFPMRLPFVSYGFTAVIRMCAHRAQLHVVLLDTPSDNLKKQLVGDRLSRRLCLSEICVVCPVLTLVIVRKVEQPT